MAPETDILILGGGPAGLAAGYYAQKTGRSFRVLEASERTGGNAITYEQDGFRFDSGAHRLHDKDAEVTQEFKDLLGDQLVRIEVPSQILHNGKLIDFPLSPFDLMVKLGPLTFARAGLDLIAARLASSSNDDGSFESFALHQYGRGIAEAFLLDYSRKLWGLPCDQLSPSISGRRLKGLNLKTFLKEAFQGKEAKTEHLDGSFYYPKKGYGMLVEALAKACGDDNVLCESRVSRVMHDGRRIHTIEINGSQRFDAEWVVSTLPLTILLRIMDPQPDKEILDLVNTLRFRDVVVAAIFLDKEGINENGSIYFPDPDYPFTRGYEPRNRSPLMAPPGKTSFCIEFPCYRSDPLWYASDQEIVDIVTQHLKPTGWVKPEEIVGSKIVRLPNAYPVLELGFEEKIEAVMRYLDRFENLRLSGRSGKFVYTHVHDMMRFGIDIIDELNAADGRSKSDSN